MDVYCIICKERVSDVVNVGEKGRKTLVTSSLERGDGLHELFENTTPLQIHAVCRKNYTRKCSIVSAKRKSSCLEESANEETTQLRSVSSKVFNIKADCIFCSEPVVQDTKYPSHRRASVSSVETLEFQSTVLDYARKRDDRWGKDVIDRVQHEYDLVAAEAKYHRSCAQSFLKKHDEGTSKENKKSIRQEAFEKLCKFLDENDECQYSIQELSKYMTTFLEGREGYSLKHLKRKLKEHYGDDLVVTSIKGNSNIVSFRDSAHKILHDKWKRDRVPDAVSQSDRILDMAASIILNDIRLTVYNNDEYSTFEGTENGDTLIPQSLKRLIHNVVDSKGRNTNVSNRKCTSIAHAIISATRPRSFVSPILLGTGVYIHRKYGSRELIDILSSMSFADDYKEVQRFEQALMSQDEPSYNLGGFTQFVFDNADFNVATLSGHNTFHNMGGIACVTPPGVIDKSPIKRSVKLQSAKKVGTFGRIPVKTYNKPVVPGLQTIVICPLKKLDLELKSLQTAVTLDSLWVAGYILELDVQCPSWSGFMKVAVKNKEYERTRIETLPFIDLDPSNPSTIYTALCFAQSQCEKKNLRICTVTFDQPLYIKAAEIVTASRDLDKIILRLGGFHLLMSYLGSIGYIMDGSGLSELWETVYAKGSIVHMQSGHAFSRSLRAHFLTAAALISILMSSPDTMNRIDKDHLASIYDALLNEQGAATDVVEEKSVKDLHQIISQLLKQSAEQSRTGKLWVQYIQQVSLLQCFIRAERIGDWKLHLSCVREMIPHFHAAGHLPYAKSARLYLQQMEFLEKEMPEAEYTLFTEKGYFTIRRSDSFWGGNFSDQTIEQFLMRQLKTSGGVTHGRGITDSTLAKWVHAFPHCVPICNELEEFAGVHTGTSEQHRDLRQSTRSRDNKDWCTFVEWLRAHPPFSGYQTDRLVSLSTGIVADSTVNCDRAVETGLAAAMEMNGRKFTDIKLRRSDKVKTIGARSKTVKIRGQNTEVNPEVLFNRITCILNNSAEMESFFAYELAPQPPSLFKGGVMRKATKSTLGLLLKSFTQQSNLPENCFFVLDGGHLLQSVVWPHPSTYENVVQHYVSYVLKHYGAHSTVVFDGYESASSTKIAEQRRRAQKCTSSDIIFEGNMPTTTTQAAFLANGNNKMRLIQSIREKMLLKGIQVKQAKADADTLIVSTALEVSESKQVPVVVVGTDTDLLVMMVARATASTDVHMLCHSNPITVFNIHEIQHALGDTKDHLMFLHAMTGCDTVSAIYRQGKRKAFNMVHNKQQDYAMLDTFRDSSSTHDEVRRVGEAFILKLYGANTFESLDNFRHISYKRIIGRSSLSSTFLLESLPPTSAAAKQHSYRTFHTVQEWMGNSLPPTEWGWRLQDGDLSPIETDIAVAPDNLLNMVSCGCKPDGCRSTTCSCKKLRLYCTSMCSKCSGLNCHNTAPTLIDAADEDDNMDIKAGDTPALADDNDVDDD